MFSFFYFSLHAQEKWNLNVGGNISAIKKEFGYGGDILLRYHTSEKTSVYGGGTYWTIHLPNTNKHTYMLQYKLGANYNLTTGNTKIATISGFSLLNSNETLLLEKDYSIGIDLGVMLVYNEGNKTRYGSFIINTYSPYSNGAIIQMGFFVDFNL
ncbi:MAG: hypothetical protein Q4B43_03645 [Bacteroidota bacterium]|nr:hypothetical protein [Bacteroidota bacterium]